MFLYELLIFILFLPSITCVNCSYWNVSTINPANCTSEGLFCYEWYVPQPTVYDSDVHEGGCIDDVSNRFAKITDLCSTHMTPSNQQVCLRPSGKIVDKCANEIQYRYGFLCCCYGDYCNSNWSSGSNIKALSDILRGSCEVGSDHAVQKCQLGSICVDYYIPLTNEHLRQCAEIERLKPFCPVDNYTKNFNCGPSKRIQDKKLVWLCCCEGFICNRHLDAYNDYLINAGTYGTRIFCHETSGSTNCSTYGGHQYCFDAYSPSGQIQVKGCFDDLTTKTGLNETDINDCIAEPGTVMIRGGNSWFYVCCSKSWCNKENVAEKEYKKLIENEPKDKANCNEIGDTIYYLFNAILILLITKLE